MAKTKDDAEKAAATSDKTLKKRGRGRPPTGAAKKVYVPTGRPRGRPLGSGVKKSVTKPKKITGGTGKRGRPKKDTAGATTLTTPARATSGKRGRPRKSTPDEEQEPEAGAEAEAGAGAEAESESEPEAELAPEAEEMDEEKEESDTCE